MNKVVVVFIVFLTFIGYSQKYTALSNPTDCKQKINHKAKETSSITANFTELIHSSMFNSVKEAQGKLTYQKANKIRWEHTSPKSQIILINNDKMKMKENGKVVQNVKTNQVMKKVQNLMMELFSGDFLNEKEFNIKYFQNNSNYKLILSPKSARMSKYIANVEMVFNKKTLALSELTLLESEMDKIVYSFSSVYFNKAIPESIFNQF